MLVLWPHSKSNLEIEELKGLEFHRVQGEESIKQLGMSFLSHFAPEMAT